MFRSLKFFRGKALKYAILSIVFILLSAVANVVQPIFLMIITNCVEVIQYKENQSILGLVVTTSNAWGVFWTSVGGMGLAAVIGLAFGLLSYYWSAKGSLHAVKNLRNACYSKILTYSFKELDKISTASIITRLATDAQKIQMALQMIISTFLQSLIMMIGGCIIAFTTNAIMGAIVVGLFALMCITCGIVGMKVMPMFSLFERTIDDSSEVMRENALGVRVIKSFNLEERKLEEYAFINKGFRRIAYRAQKWMLPLMSIIMFALNFGIVGIMTVGGVMLKNNPSDTKIGSEIYGLVQVLVMVLTSAVGAVMVVVNIVRTIPSFKRCNEILDINSTIVDSKNPKNIKEKYEIEFKNVNFKYTSKAENYVLKDISFKVKEGETLGIIGATGSGKTSLINLIPRLYDVSEGSVTIGGVDVKDLKIDDLRKKIKVALQELILFAGDIQYNLKYGKSNATIDEMKHACEQACAWEFVSTLPKKLEAPVEQRGRNFSGGQKQRLCLARAIIGKPKILILDDVTCALDMLTEKKVQRNLKQSLPKTTKIIVSQRVSSIINADKIIVLDKGMINGMGTHDQLVKSNEIYREIVESQMNTKGLEG